MLISVNGDKYRRKFDSFYTFGSLYKKMVVRSSIPPKRRFLRRVGFPELWRKGVKRQTITPGTHRPLIEREVRVMIPEVRKAVLRHIDERGSIKIDSTTVPNHYAIREDHPEIIAEGDEQVVLNLGNMHVDGANLPIVVKVSKVRGAIDEKGKLLLSASPTTGRSSEMLASHLREKGFPVVMTHFIPLDKYGVHGVVLSPNLQRRGHTLSEANGFDFRKLENGRELQTELLQHVKTLKQMEQDEEIYLNRHTTNDRSDEGFKRAFHIDWNQRTKRGRLLMSDLDHITLAKTSDRINDLSKRIHQRAEKPPDF